MLAERLLQMESWKPRDQELYYIWNSQYKKIDVSDSNRVIQYKNLFSAYWEGTNKYLGNGFEGVTLWGKKYLPFLFE